MAFFCIFSLQTMFISAYWFSTSLAVASFSSTWRFFFNELIEISWSVVAFCKGQFSAPKRFSIGSRFQFVYIILHIISSNESKRDRLSVNAISNEFGIIRLGN